MRRASPVVTQGREEDEKRRATINRHPRASTASNGLAALLRLAARPLLGAQQRAWESGNHPGILLAGAVVRSLTNAVAGRVHLHGAGQGGPVRMQDGEQLTIFRRMGLDARGESAPSGEFRVRFHARMAPRLNQWFSWLTIPLFAGLPGFRDKTWLVNEATGFRPRSTIGRPSPTPSATPTHPRWRS